MILEFYTLIYYTLIVLFDLSHATRLAYRRKKILGGDVHHHSDPKQEPRGMKKVMHVGAISNSYSKKLKK